MTIEHERYVKQLDGSRFAGVNCTCASGAMGCFRHSLGGILLNGARVRTLTGDTSGGTNLSQIHFALAREGQYLDGPYYGMSLHTFYQRIRDRGALVQGSSRATINSRWRASTTFRGNHCWYVAGGRNWDAYGPKELHVYDPLADGRRPGIAKAPFWLPRSYFEEFARYLDIGGRVLGPGKVYVLFTRDTRPHFHPHSGGVALVPMPQALAVKSGYNIRATPGGAKVARTDAAKPFVAYQRASGPLMGGSRVWFGSHNGNRWIHASARR